MKALKSTGVDLKMSEVEFLNFITEDTSDLIEDFDMLNVSMRYSYQSNGIQEHIPNNIGARQRTIMISLMSLYIDLKGIYTLPKLMAYMRRAITDQGFESVEKFCVTLKDYINISIDNDFEYRKYSDRLQIQHDILMRNLKLEVTQDQ
jgi:hypothetical protein